MSALTRALGQAGNERGRRAEQRVVDAIERSALDWGVRLATPEEDARGIDVVVTVGSTKFYLQVKASKTGAREFRRQRARAKHIALVVVGDADDRLLLIRVMSAVGDLRRRFAWGGER